MFHHVKGSYDIVPESEESWKESSAWHRFETTALELSALFGFQEIRTPVFEYTETFTRSVGEETDVISKEMYTFLDKADRSISLRPEMTASIVRAYIENGLHHKECDRFFYMGPCFRYDRMQKGRYRQFHQFGAEIFGVKDPYLDVETIHFLMQLYKRLDLKNISLKINAIGDKESRKTFAKALQSYFTPFAKELSEDSKRRLITNPMRILDSKAECDQALKKNAPNILEFLSAEGKSFFDDVLKGLTSLKIPYVIDSSLVRGLDYYCDTVFEVVSTTDSGAQNALGGGGRYDGLMKEMGGEDLAGFGFGTGIERILQHMSISKAITGPMFYIIPLSAEAKSLSFSLVDTLRNSGKSALLHFKNYNLKKGLQRASALQAHYAVLIGDEELSSKVLTIKCLSTREEKKVPLHTLSEVLV